MMRLILIAIVSSLLFGCATHYPNTLDKNVTIKLNMVKNGGIFTSAEAVVGVNDINKDCSYDYKGFVTLHQGTNEIGLALNKPTLFVVEISHKTFGGSSRSIQRDALLTPKPGVSYLIDVNYVDAMFDYRLYEVTRSGKKQIDVTNRAPWCKS